MLRPNPCKTAPPTGQLQSRRVTNVSITPNYLHHGYHLLPSPGLRSHLCRRAGKYICLTLTNIILIILFQALLQDRSPIPETSGNVHKVLKPADLDALLSSTTNVVVDFYADWCPPCRAIAPVFSRLADQHATKGHLAFAKVNVDHVNDVAARYAISAMPTFVFFEGGKPTPVAVSSSSSSVNLGSPSVVASQDGKGVERVRGADVKTLTAVVEALGEKAKLAAGVSGSEGGGHVKAKELKA